MNEARMKRKSESSACTLQAALVLCLAAVLTAPACSRREPEARPAGADWPNWRGADWNGISTETSWSPENLKKEAILWTAEVGRGYSSMAVVSDRMYTSGTSRDGETVYCMNAETGAVVWGTVLKEGLSFGSNGPQSTPTVRENRLYTFTPGGTAYCLDAGSGRILWKRDLRNELKLDVPIWGFSSSVRLHGDMALVNAGRAGVALDSSDGKILWSTGNRQAGYSTPVVFSFMGKEAMAVASVTEFNVVELESGKILRTFPWTSGLHDYPADPLVIGDRALVSHAYQQGAAFVDLSADPPAPVWEDRKLISNLNSFVRFGNLVYGNSNPKYNYGDLGAEFFCLDATTGKKLWSYPDRLGTVIAVNGCLIRLDQYGNLSAGPASPDGFTAVSSFRVFSGPALAHPAFSDGRLFCRNDMGTVVCLDLRTRTAR